MAMLTGETQEPAAKGAGSANWDDDGIAWARWSSCAAVAILAHLLIAPLMLGWQTDADTVAPAATIVIELSPVVAAPQVQQMEAPPIPEQIEGELPPDEMVREEVEEERKGDGESFEPKLQMIEPKPETKPETNLDMTALPLPRATWKSDAETIQPTLQQAPVAAIEEKSEVQLAPPPNKDDGKQAEAPRSAPPAVKPPEPAAQAKPARPAVNRPRRQDRTAAKPQAARAEEAPVQAPAASTPSTSTALPNWRSQVIGILERNKHYPPEAQARQEHGVSSLAFSMNRQGRVTSARIAGSSGSAALDAETLALVHRVQPFPPPPPEVAGAQISLVVAIRYR